MCQIKKTIALPQGMAMMQYELFSVAAGMLLVKKHARL
jgi:hypothetical protein